MEPPKNGPIGANRVTKKRNRPPVSCGHCRIRKLKCDRAKPCGACVKTGDASTCSYVSNRPDGPRDSHSTPDQPSRDELINRIDRLEQLVLSTMQPPPTLSEIPPLNITPSDSTGSDAYDVDKILGIENDPDLDQLATAFGVLKVDQHKTTYLGGGSWVSIMSDIKEFRSHLVCNVADFEHDAIQKQASVKSSSLFLGTAPPKRYEDLLPYIPPKPIADQLVARCFELYSCVLPIVHEPTFMKQYESHWQDPESTNVIWLALLFGMFRLAEMSFEGSKNEISTMFLGAGNIFRDRTIDCLIAGDYTNPQENTIEALLFYAHAEWMDSEDSRIDLSAVIGMTVRLAMRMGIHRESKRHFGLTPFKEEMRRRVWARLRVMDIQYSFQISLPASVRSNECDCSLPRNIRDQDFDSDTATLPTALSLTEDTEISFMIMKTRMTIAFGEILAFIEVSNPISTETVREFERQLLEIHNDIPARLRISSPGVSKATFLGFNSERIHLDRIYQAARCILYRKFLRPSSPHVIYRGLCIDAAMSLLSHHATLLTENDLLLPQNVKQRHRSIFISHDFYVACMAIAIDLHHGYESDPSSPSKRDVCIWGYDRRQEMIHALETSTKFWGLSRKDSTEAAKAHGIFSFVLQRVKSAQATIAEGNKWISPGTITDYEATPLDVTTGMNQAADWPIDIDWEMWSSWKGDDETFGLTY